MVFRRRTPARVACSFCGLGADQVSKLIAGPSVHICGSCIDLCNRIVAGEEAASFDADDDVETMLASIRATSATVDSMSDLLHRHIGQLRERDVSWQRIADALGTSRQAAWERFR